MAGTKSTAKKKQQQTKLPAASSGASRKTAPQKRRHYLPADERRQLILDAAKEVFARSGLQGSRTRDLAEAAGINQATLFGHFKSKEDLFAAAVLQPLVALLDGVRERYQSYEAADSPEALSKLINTGLQKHLEKIIEIYPLLIQVLFSDPELGKKLYQEQIQPLIKARSELVRDVVKETIDPDLIELASFGMFFAVAMDRAMTGKTGDLSEVSKQLSEMILFGCVRRNTR